MSAFVPRVTHVDVLEPYQLAVGFIDGTAQQIDFEPLLHGKWFGQLRDLATFKSVAIDPHGSLTWPNGVTVSLWKLHDWPNAGPALIAEVKRNDRHMRRLRTAQRWLCGATGLWFLWNVGSWAGWIGGEPASPRDVTGAAAILAMSVGLLVQDRSTAWGFILFLAWMGLLAVSFSLR